MPKINETLNVLAEKMKNKHPGISDKDALRLARAKCREEKAKEAISKILSRQSEKARKERTRMLIQLGGLVKKAGLDSWDFETLLGGLLALKGKEQDPAIMEKFRLQGSETPR